MRTVLQSLFLVGHYIAEGGKPGIKTIQFCRCLVGRVSTPVSAGPVLLRAIIEHGINHIGNLLHVQVLECSQCLFPSLGTIGGPLLQTQSFLHAVPIRTHVVNGFQHPSNQSTPKDRFGTLLAPGKIFDKCCPQIVGDCGFFLQTVPCGRDSFLLLDLLLGPLDRRGLFTLLEKLDRAIAFFQMVVQLAGYLFRDQRLPLFPICDVIRVGSHTFILVAISIILLNGFCLCCLEQLFHRWEILLNRLPPDFGLHAPVKI